MLILESDRLKLRAPEPTDLNLLDLWENDKSLWHLSNTIAPLSKFLLKEYIKNSYKDIYEVKQLRLMIDFFKEVDQTITVGTIDLFEFDPVNLRAGIGIMIEKEYRARGIGSEALKLMIDYCSHVLKLHTLFCNILDDNEASLSLFFKAGFEIVGKKIDWVRIGNDFKDEYLLQLIIGNTEKL